MLCFDLQLLDEGPVTVDDRLESSDPVWNDEDSRPAAGVIVSGRLSVAGTGRYYFTGDIHGSVSGECRLCLGSASCEVHEEVDAMFAESGDDEILDDPDVFMLDTREGELDLRPAIREQWLLSAPAFLQCREDCKGLCPSCGADLNTVACSCPPPSDSRWDALRVPRDAGI
jgi:uncharacterized protein